MLLLVLLSMAALVLGQDLSDVVHIERHTIKLECPSRAVCADVYSLQRSGVPERRAIYNCHCPGQEGRCPLDDSRMLHQSISRRMYLCEPLAAIPDCSMSNSRQVAEETIRDSEHFEYNSYVKVKCVCPRHKEPVAPEPGHIERAVTWLRNHRDPLSRIMYEQYVCITRTRQYYDRYQPYQNRHSGK